MAQLVEHVRELLSLHAQRQFGVMERRARASLRRFPKAPLLEELLGVALMSQRRCSDALVPLQRAVRADPNDAQFWENLGLCQYQLGQYAEAEVNLRQSLSRRPRSPNTLVALGSVLRALERLDEAQQILEQALAIDPGHFAALFNLGNVLISQHRLDRAEQQFRRGLVSAPLDARLHSALGLVLMKRADWSGAEASFRRAIDLDRNNPQAFIGYASLALGRHNLAEASAAIETALRQLGGAATPISTDNIVLLESILDLLLATDRDDDALALAKHLCAHQISPAGASNVFLAARRMCDWRLAEQAAAVVRRGLSPNSASEIPPFSLLAMENIAPEDQLLAARNFASQFSVTIEKEARPGGKRDRVRIGYCSFDFRDHPVTHLISGVIEAHDRERLEVIACDFTPPVADAYRRRIESGFDRIVPIGDLSGSGAASRIAAEGVDILVDLMGWTRGHRAWVLSARPAPLQVFWLGFAGTTGAPWIDYMIADEVTVPHGEEASFSEKIIRLPNTLMPTDDKQVLLPLPDRNSCGLPDRAFVFCSFNHSFKITPSVFDIWMKLLSAVPGSILWLGRMTAPAIGAVRARATELGVSPDRLIFAPRVATFAEHLARLGQADLALDCIPYGSHTTATDALWAGVPLVALRGDTFAGRISASVVAGAGLSELVTTSLDDYYALALRLATNEGARDVIRARLKEQRHSAALFDTKRFTGHLDAAFLAIWDRHQAGLPPDHTTVS
jgi:predicted O-linked N-acetylglucosamine transferase (SPINDLY family)